MPAHSIQLQYNKIDFLFLFPIVLECSNTKIKPDVKAHSPEMSTLLVQQFPPDKQVF